MRRLSILALFLFAALPAFGATFTVNDLVDDPDETLDGTCDTAGAGTICTLRAAIMEANAQAGGDTITFSVAGAIVVASPLPAITERVDIDGTTAPGYTTAPVVDVNGTFSIPVGFDFAAGSSSSTLVGLQIYGFTDAGVRIVSDTVQVRRNYIGPVSVGGAQNNIGIDLAGTGSSIGGADGDGNVISGNLSFGILVAGSGHSIRDNFIGTDAAATAAIANGDDGISVQGATNVTIGSSVANEWNVISGNGADGVDIVSGTGNVVAGNFIGTDLAGTTAIGNSNAGVRVGSAGNTVGTTAARNVVSGNLGVGILVLSTSAVTVRNNYTGPDVTGNVGIGNFEEGIRVVNSSNVDIGGTAAGEGNVASFNGSDGISIAEANDIRIYGNIAGLNAAGTATLGNGFAGIAISAGIDILVGSLTGSGGNVVSGNSFGGIVSGFGTGNIFEANRVGTNGAGTADEGNLGTGILIGSSDGDIVRSNLVSGNDGHGIEVTLGSVNAVIHSNIIGLSADLSTAIPNTGDGVNVCDGAENTVVGSVALGGNTIASNGANGIGVEPSALLNNTWAANSIYANTGLGIDLHEDGATPNDPDDIDTGANNLQNFPVIVSAVTTPTGSQVRGTINTTPNTAITVHVYSSPPADADATGGEGRTYLGETSFTTDGSGNASWVMNGAPSTVNDFVSATATAPDGSSEFSENLLIGPAPTVQFSQAIYTVTENGVIATITVTRTGDLSVESTVQYTTSDLTAVAGSDYTTASGTLTFVPTDASETFDVPITNDVLDEPAEFVTLTLSNPTAATLGAQSTAQLEITDDDLPPTITIDNVSLAEGNAGATNFIFTISLSAISGQQVDVNYATADGSATAGDDYTTTNGVATIPAGSLSTQVTVPVLGDNVVEPDETFTVNLTNAVNATITDSEGLGTIENDEGLPMILISSPSVAEGDAGTTNFIFDVSLTAQSATPVTVDYATADGTAAAASSDYTAIPTTTLTFPALSTSQQITVTVAGDIVVEPNEAFFVNLSNPSGAIFGDDQGMGTIINDDGLPTILISDVSLAEGDGGTTNFVFDVTLSAPSASPVTVNYATADGTATASSSDYTAIPTTTLTFPALSTSQQITVAVAGDILVEPNETFFVNLSNPSGATFGDNQGQGTITNDDLNADLSVAKTASSPTFTSGQQITFTITVTNAGPGPAPNVTVTDVLPAGTTFVSASAGCSGTTTVSCNLGTMTSGTSTPVSIVVTATGTSNITNTATVASAASDPVSGNDTGSTTITAAAAAEAAIPTLSTWMLLLLGASLALVAARRIGVL